MSAVAMMEAALFQLRGAADQVDEMFAPQIRLGVNVLANALAAAHDGVNAAHISDIEFALNDLLASAHELTGADSTLVMPALEMLQKDLEQLKKDTALPPRLIEAMRALRAKLVARKQGLDRQQYLEVNTAPIPHPPEELRQEAQPIRDGLIAAGFATPAFDVLDDDPSAFRYHSINEMIDEIDVILQE